MPNIPRKATNRTLLLALGCFALFTANLIEVNAQDQSSEATNSPQDNQQVIASVSDTTAENDNHEALRKEIQKAWDKRLSLVKSTRFNLETTNECKPIFYLMKVKPSLDFYKSLKSKEQLDQFIEENKDPLVYSYNTELLVDGKRIRFTRSGQLPSNKPPIEIKEFYRLEVTDGEVSKSFYDKAAALNYPSGFVNNTKGCQSIIHDYTLPIRSWIDPGRGDFCPIVDPTLEGTITLSPKKSDKLITLNNDKGKMYLDPNKDYSIVKWEGRGQYGNTSMEIEYQPDNQTQLWVPANWELLVYMKDGSVGLASTSRVTEYEINPEFAVGDFQFEYPPVSKVSDMRPTAEGYHERRGSAFYVIKENGEKRPVTWEERFGPVDELFTTEEGDLAPKPKELQAAEGLGLHLWLLVGNGLCFILIIGVILLKKYRKSAASS